VPPVPFTTLVLFTLVSTGATGADDTVKVNDCVESGGVPLLTVTVNVYVPAGTLPGIAIRPFALSIDTPAGAPVKE